MGTLTASRLDGILTSIGVLEAEFKSDSSTYHGTKARNGGPWSGTGINRARRIQSGLNADGPENQTDAADRWKEAWTRVSKIVQ